MKKFFCYIIFFITFCGPAAAQNTFQKIVELQGYGFYPLHAEENPKGGFTKASILYDAATRSYNNFSLLKYDSCYNVVLANLYKINGYRFSSSYPLTLTKDYEGNFIAGARSTDGMSKPCIAVTKFNSAGTLQWSKEYCIDTSSPTNYFNALKVDEENNIYLTWRNIRGNWIQKLDKNGTLLFSKKLVIDSGQFHIQHLLPYKSDVLISGRIGEPGNKYRLFYAKMDSSGNMVWLKASPNSIYNFDLVRQVILLNDSTFLIAGETQRFSKNTGPRASPHIFVLTISENGKLNNTFSLTADTSFNAPATYIKDLRQANDTIYLMFWTNTGKPFKTYVAKIDTAQITQQGKYFVEGIYSYHNRTPLVPAPDGGFTYFAREINGGSLVIKTDEHLNSGCNEGEFEIDLLPKQFALTEPNYSVQHDSMTTNDITHTITTTDLIPLLRQTTLCTNFEPTAQLPGDTVLCFGATMHIDAQWAGASKVNTSPFTKFLWSTGDTTPTIDFTAAAGTHQVWVRISKGACTSSDTMQVTFLQNVLVDLGEDTTTCPYETIAIDAGSNAVNFFWYTPAGDTIKSKTIFAADSGQYRIRVADAGGCVDLDTLHLGHYNLPKADAGPDTSMCYGDTLQLQGSGGNTFLWQPPTYLSDAFIAGPLATPPAGQTYQLIVVDENGCNDTDEVFIAVGTPITAQITTSATDICEEDSVNFFAVNATGGTGNYTFSWLDSTETVLGQGEKFGIKAPIATQSINHIFIYLELNDGECFSFKDSAKITIHGKPEANFTATPTEGCEPLEVSFTTHNFTQTDNLTWYFDADSATTGGVAKKVYKNPGTYIVKHIAENSIGCIDSSVQEITVFAKPVVSFTAAPEVARIDDATIGFVAQANNADSLLWDFGDNSGTKITTAPSSIYHTYNDTGYFTINLIGFNEYCSDTATGTVYIRDLVRIHMPNAFTPNTSDEINPTFEPVTTAIKSWQLSIFSRWGGEIFVGHNKGWDGQLNGTPAPEGIYVYILKATDDIGEDYYLHGNVTLLRVP